MTQDEWLFKIAEIPIKKKKMYNYYGSGHSGYLNATLAPNVNQVSDVERLRIIEKMKNYWKEHKSSSLEFLVNDAIVNCDKGSIMSRVKGKDHGVYTDHDGGLALLNEDDRKLVETDLTVFGSCACEVGKKNKCKAKNFSKWYGVNSNTHIGKGKASLIMSSYMICPYYKNAYIRPVTSGQEFTFTDSLFKYPKFVVEQGMEHAYFNIEYWNKYNFEYAKIDMTVIRKLAIRNISIMNQGVEGTNTKGYYERKWLGYLAKYVLLCEDKNILKNIINCFYENIGVSMLSRCERRELLENYYLLLESMQSIFYKVLEHQSDKSYIDSMNIYEFGKDSVAKMIKNYFLIIVINSLHIYTLQGNISDSPPISKISQLPYYVEKRVNDIEMYYRNGIKIEYCTSIYATDNSINKFKIEPNSLLTEGNLSDLTITSSYISDLKTKGDTQDMEELWKYFDKTKKTFFGETLFVNVEVTYLLSLINPEVALIPSIIWTVSGSFASQWAEGILQSSFEKIAHEQSGSSLMQLIDFLQLHIMYSNIRSDYYSFMYMIFPGENTGKIINIFLNNIGRIYVRGRDDAEEKSLLNLLNLNNKVRGTVYEKVNYLIKALTTETISSSDIPGIEINVFDTGIGILKNLDKLSFYDSKLKGYEESEVLTVKVNVVIDGEKIDIKDTSCYTGSSVNMDILFGEAITKK